MRHQLITPKAVRASLLGAVSLWICSLVITGAAFAGGPSPGARPTDDSAKGDTTERAAPLGVQVNGVQVPEETLVQFQEALGWRVPDGIYWYDATCGAWGFPGGPTQGFIMPLLPLGGPLRADASGGGDGQLTGVFINGREIHPSEAYALSQLVPVSAGRYWLDAYGNAGYEGGPALVNLYQLASSQRGNGGGYNHSGPGGHTGSDGDTFYYFDPQSGASVMNNGY